MAQNGKSRRQIKSSIDVFLLSSVLGSQIYAQFASGEFEVDERVLCEILILTIDDIRSNPDQIMHSFVHQ